MSDPSLLDMWDPICSQHPDLFHSEDRAEINQAKKYCAECPVKKECLEMGLELIRAPDGARFLPYGIWGGYSKDQRSKMRGARRRQEAA